VPGPGLVLAPGLGVAPRLMLATGLGEAVVGIRPGGCLIRILAGRADPGGQARQPGSAALADLGEGHLVPGEFQGDLVGFPQPVPARYRDNAED
jgi:hypothetical protein